MTPTKRLVLTLCAAVLSCAAALGLHHLATTAPAQDTASTSTPAPTTEELDVIAEGCDSGQVTDAGQCVPADTITDQPAPLPCRTIDLGSIPDAVYDQRNTDQLMAEGWWSTPTDRAERIYSPECAHP